MDTRYASGSLRRRRNAGQWECSLSHTDPVTGEVVRTYHTLVAKTQRQAERARDALIVELGSWEVRLPPASPCTTSWPRSCATRRTPAPSSPPPRADTAPGRASSAATPAT